MKNYLRMLRMIKPYLAHVGLAVVFMVMFSFFSIFSITMISPFLEALFYKDTAPVSVEAAPGAAVGEMLFGETAGADSTTTGIASADSAATVSAATDSAATDLAASDLLATQSRLDRWKNNTRQKANEYLLRGSRQDALLRICIVFFFLVLAKNVTGYIQEILMVLVSQRVIRDLRLKIFVAYTRLPLGFFHRHKAGALISRATNDVQVAEKCVNVAFTNMIRDPLFILMYLGLALILSWKLTLLALVLLPLSLGIIIRIGKKVRKYSWRQQEEIAKLTSVLQETIYGIRVIKAFAMEAFEVQKFARENQQLYRYVFKNNWVMKTSSPLTEQLSVGVGLSLLWYGGSKVFTGGDMTPDLFIIFLFCIFSLVRPIKNLGSVNNAVQEGMAAAERIFVVLDEPPESADPEAGYHLDTVRGAVEFRQVNFSYLPSEPVLRDINLKVAPGEMVALVGSSGAGKSTLVDLIAGFHLADEGQVLVDDHDIRELNLNSLRRHLGVVTQEVILFNDTIRNNIAYGTQEATEEAVVAAAQAANADRFIQDLPEGYETRIGDRGINLSGGQRQRLSIARAILKNPPILLLDEATSALDSESELLVQGAIDKLVQDRTTVVIAHRLSTIQNVDRIYVLDAGRIVQEGSHAELLAAGGRYRELYELQFLK